MDRNRRNKLFPKMPRSLDVVTTKLLRMDQSLSMERCILRQLTWQSGGLQLFYVRYPQVAGSNPVEGVNKFCVASLVQWQNARLPRRRPGFDSRTMHQTNFSPISAPLFPLAFRSTLPQPTYWEVANGMGDKARQDKISGDGGYRFAYLSHSKLAIYHQSYVPCGAQKGAKRGSQRP